MDNKHKNIITTKTNDVYKISMLFPDKENEIPILETNITTIVNVMNSFLNENIENYLYLEQVGNLGWIAFCESFNPLFFIIKTALTKKRIPGVYLNVLMNIEEHDEDTGKIENIDFVYDTRVNGHTPTEEYTFIIDAIYETVCMTLAGVHDEGNEDEYLYDELVEQLLSDGLVKKINDLYINRITPKEFLKYMGNEISEKESILAKSIADTGEMLH